MAQSRLSPQALSALEAILGPGVSLEEIATCPDNLAFAPNPTLSCAGFTISLQVDPAATKLWHTIRIPFDANVDAASIMNYCPQDNCVVAQIHKDVAVLRDAGASLEDKRTALMFLVHFVGDVHQPLHSATGVPDDGDGWLKVMHAISYLGKPLNLHQVWDDAMDDPSQVNSSLPDGTLTAQAETLAHTLGGAGLQDAASWATGDLAVEAALESHDIAQTVIYPAYEASQGNDSLADYRAKMQPIAYRRIQTASVRLSALLEQALVGEKKNE
jgi:hypothetical protein